MAPERNFIHRSRFSEYSQIYQSRREERLKKITMEERAKRNHVAKPMPNFNGMHNAVRFKESAKVVSPETPDVLKRSYAMREKIKRKQEEHFKKLAERPPILAREAIVLKAKPFEPTIVEKAVTKVKPFNLKMNDRLAERKKEDMRREQIKALREEMIAKKKQEEEEELRKQIRKQTNFKARANPFKKTEM